MPVHFACSCGQKYNVKDEYAGKRTKCPACGASLLVPARSAAKGTSAPKSPAITTQTPEASTATRSAADPTSFEALSAIVTDYCLSPDYSKSGPAKASLPAIGNFGDRRSITFLANQLGVLWSNGVSYIGESLYDALLHAVRKLMGMPEIEANSPPGDWSERFNKLDHQLAKTLIPALVGVVVRHRHTNIGALKRALQTLVSFAPHSAVPLLISSLHINRINAEELQVYCACTLAEIRDKRAVDALMDALEIDHICVRFAAAKALAQIAGMKGADELPYLPRSWNTDMKRYEPEFYRLLKEASDFFRPNYRKADWSSGRQFAVEPEVVSPNQGLLLSEACRGFDEMHALKLEDTPVNRQVKTAMEHIQQKRIAKGDTDWVCTVCDFPGYNDDYLTDLESRIKWGAEPLAEDRRKRILLKTAEEELLTAMRNMHIFKKVGDKGQYAGFLLYPHLRDCRIDLD